MRRLRGAETGRWAHHEGGVEPAQPDLDGLRGKVAGDLARRRGQRAEEGQSYGRLQRGSEAFRDGEGLLPCCLRGEEELAADVLDEGRQLHGAMMAH
ncbi:hypothetical protein [Streptomyces sp. NPDC060333]|uniref:hypothetical protein n=1 Tax=Streptomyces sp. NPDC060333 TaxID=3347098 RepID=UPI0036528F2D